MTNRVDRARTVVAVLTLTLGPALLYLAGTTHL
jgi:hypothetical protein